VPREHRWQNPHNTAPVVDMGMMRSARRRCEKGSGVRATRVQPTGVERTFGDHEIIVSKTDAKGRIEYANDVFVRVSGYSEHELLGQPHNVIRHPDMPRAVFSLMWETIGAGQEIFAYVNNLAADGSHYWVLAHVTPSYGRGRDLAGYHSNRRCPERGAVREADLLYRVLRAEELRHARPADALAASTALLGRALADRGQTYEECVWNLISGATVGA